MACLVALVGCSPSMPCSVNVPRKDFQFSFAREPYINPKIIQDFSTWISDKGDQVVAINVLESQDSNRYFGDVQVRKTDGQNPFVYLETTTVENGETNRQEFGYNYVGMTKSGVHVLYTSDWGGGSGVFKNLLLLAFEYDNGIGYDWDKREIRSDGKRLLLKKLGEIPLGDRWDGELKVEGNSIFVGKDKGWFTVSGGTGGGNRN